MKKTDHHPILSWLFSSGVSNLTVSYVKPDVSRLKKFFDRLWKEYPLKSASKNRQPTKRCRQALARKQSQLTAMLVQRMFGGDVLHGRANGVTHYWNRVGSKEFDLTKNKNAKDLTPICAGRPLTHPFKELAALIKMEKKLCLQIVVINLPLLAEPFIYQGRDSHEVWLTDGANTVLLNTKHSVRNWSLPTVQSSENPPIFRSTLPELDDGQLEEIIKNAKVYFNLISELQKIPARDDTLFKHKILGLLLNNIWVAEAVIEEMKKILEYRLRATSFDLHFKVGTARCVPEGYIVRIAVDRFCLVKPGGKIYSLAIRRYDAVPLFRYVKCWETIASKHKEHFIGDKRDYHLIATAVGKFNPALATVLAS